MCGHRQNSTVMRINLTFTLPFIDRKVHNIFNFFLFLLIVILNDVMCFFHFFLLKSSELIEHIVDFIQHWLIFHFLFFGFIFLAQGLPSNVLIFTHKTSHILILILDYWALAFPHFYLLAELAIALGQVYYFALKGLLLLLFQLLCHNTRGEILLLELRGVWVVVLSEHHLLTKLVKVILVFIVEFHHVLSEFFNVLFLKIDFGLVLLSGLNQDKIVR